VVVSIAIENSLQAAFFQSMFGDTHTTNNSVLRFFVKMTDCLLKIRNDLFVLPKDLGTHFVECPQKAALSGIVRANQ
jgi:hypothetical protein